MRSRVVKTLGLVVAMVACVGMTVLAAPSPSASTPVKSAAAKDAKGNVVNITITSTIPAEYKAVVESLKTEAGLKEALGTAFNANMTIADVQEITVPEGTEFPLDITFNMDVAANTKAQVLHYTDGAWKMESTSVVEGAVIAKGIESLSPFAVVVDKTTLPSGVNVPSPKTSASAVSAIAVVGLAAVVAVCGFKKKSYAK